MVSRYIAIDTNVFTFLIESTHEGYDPKKDARPELAGQKISALRLFFYLPGPGSLVVLPTVMKEAEMIGDGTKRDRHLNWALRNLAKESPEYSPNFEVDTDKLTNSLLAHHSGESDCRILAEAEFFEESHLITFDLKLAKRLAACTRVVIKTPLDAWIQASIPKGASPRLSLPEANPLFNQSWWRW